ncbi:MAG: VTC domain-containing protein [bacterium]|nr:hypothetical protein [Deltaproteobacteria bacterium]MCP4904772.1 VTC domain-containing protein [bacterium]
MIYPASDLGEDRFEVKFVGSGNSLDVIRPWIRTHPAAFGEPFPPRVVNNVYYDTHSLGAFAENLVGASVREKVRLRWYGPGNRIADKGTLEIKLRKNKLGWKLSYPLEDMPRAGESWRRAQSRIREQLPLDARIHFDAHPMPALINRYDRTYLLSADGVIRLTVDTNLQAFDQRYGQGPDFRKPVELPDMLVVEFKFAPQDRKRAMKVLEGMPLRVSRSSKYAMACTAMTAA